MQIYLCYVDNIFSNPRKFQVRYRKDKKNSGKNSRYEKNRGNRKSLSQSKNVAMNSLDVTRNIVIPIDSRSKSGA